MATLGKGKPLAKVPSVVASPAVVRLPSMPVAGLGVTRYSAQLRCVTTLPFTPYPVGLPIMHEGFITAPGLLLGSLSG